MSAPDSTPSDYAGLSKQEVAERLKNPTPDATPRTDMLAFLIPHPLMYGKRETQFVSADLARTLGRELTEAKAEIARLNRRDGFDLQQINRVAADQTKNFLARAERAEAQLRERTQWQCKCGGTDCAGQAENERLRAEVNELQLFIARMQAEGGICRVYRGTDAELNLIAERDQLRAEAKAQGEHAVAMTELAQSWKREAETAQTERDRLQGEVDQLRAALSAAKE